MSCDAVLLEKPKAQTLGPNPYPQRTPSFRLFWARRPYYVRLWGYFDATGRPRVRVWACVRLLGFGAEKFGGRGCFAGLHGQELEVLSLGLVGFRVSGLGRFDV